ncbi:hypothetical protein FOMPIDRAFT_52819 [Fomitopsis schrenkii]|uniref:SGNH hydrolase-type esterase domain-containing protein n=1 Tax=Fomitopsis schrenkii TaxID=2126942 RepID=S8DZS0_FOMSC|nr:hypothetical protein FOMPIDRAFT_52819 [Fomitopsis schrenkii]
MIACSIGASLSGGGEENITTHECGPSQEVILVDGDSPITQVLPVKVTITLIDWASVFELESIMADSEDSVRPLPDPVPPAIRVLAIGDSITAGYSDGSQPISLGCLDAFPHVARNLIRGKAGADVELELVAYPGILLTSPTSEEAEEGAGLGMVDRFFHMSPWSDEPAVLDEQPSIILIALGTNDDAQDISPERFASAMQAFIQRLRDTYRASLKHICVLHPFPDFTEGSEPDSESIEGVPITQGLASVLASLNSEFEESVALHEWDIGKGLTKQYTMDGVHPTVEGHRVLGDALAQKMAAVLVRPQP